MRRMILIGAMIFAAAPGSAADRTYSITDFDRIIVDGPFGVTVETGPAVSARATGDQGAIDRIAVSVANRTLRVSRDKSAWGGWPGGGEGRATVRVSTPQLIAATLGGPGSLAIDRMKGGTLSIGLTGTGALRVETVEADRLAVSLTGSGQVNIAGRARNASLAQQGAGAIAADALTVEDLVASVAGSGSVTIAATRSASIVANGSGVTTVTGPAACIVKASGSGIVTCGD